MGRDLGAGRGDYIGKTGGPTDGIHIERETGFLARGALILAANTAGGVVHVCGQCNGVVVQQKVG